MTWKWGRSYLLNLWVVVQADPGLDLEDGETVADEVAVVRGVVPPEAIRPDSSWSWGLNSTSANLTGDKILGGVAAVLVIGEYLEEDVMLDGLKGLLCYL